MTELDPADIAARVVAWHNRHPLARRLRVADVHSIGHVALPFSNPAAAPVESPEEATGSLRERAAARARAGPGAAATGGAGGPLQSAFREDFIPPWTPDEVATFAAGHGVERGSEPRDAPVRRALPQPAQQGLVWRWLWTAELRSGRWRTRVLLGPAPDGPLLGRRLWSLPRIGALAALGGAVLAGALAAGGLRGSGPGEAAVAGGTLPAATPGSGTVAGTATAAPPPASADAGAGTATITPAAEAAASAAAARPLDVEPRLGRIELPPIGSIVDARRRQAAEQAASAAASTPDASAAVPLAAATPATRAPAYALATRVLRTRTESEQIARALSALLVVPGSPVQKVEVLRLGDDFRVVAWPYPARADAERAQAALRARGHALQLIDF